MRFKLLLVKNMEKTYYLRICILLLIFATTANCGAIQKEDEASENTKIPHDHVTVF